jgi:hypothetical protein
MQIGVAVRLAAQCITSNQAVDDSLPSKLYVQVCDLMALHDMNKP